MRQPVSRAPPKVTTDPSFDQDFSKSTALHSTHPNQSEEGLLCRSPLAAPSSSNSDDEKINVSHCRSITFRKERNKSSIEKVDKQPADGKSSSTPQPELKPNPNNDFTSYEQEENKLSRERSSACSMLQSQTHPQSSQPQTYSKPHRSSDVIDESLTTPLSTKGKEKNISDFHFSSSSIPRPPTSHSVSPVSSPKRKSPTRRSSSVSPTQFHPNSHFPPGRDMSQSQTVPPRRRSKSPQSSRSTPPATTNNYHTSNQMFWPLSRGSPKVERFSDSQLEKIYRVSPPRSPLKFQESVDSDLNATEHQPTYNLKKNDTFFEQDPQLTFNEQQDTQDMITEHVKMSLKCLPLQNVAVSIPEFTRWAEPSDDDKAVIVAIEDIITAEAERRKTDSFAVSNHLRVVLIVVPNFRRSEVWIEFLKRTSKLRVTSFGIHESNTQPKWYTTRELELIFDNEDIIITSASALLSVTRNDTLTLRRVALLVFDSAERISSRSHPCAVLMRDYYRALPFDRRPRVLAIAIDQMCGGRMPPIEYNLISKFVLPDSTGKAVWKSCYSYGSRPADAGFLDVENIWYKPYSLDCDVASPMKTRNNTSIPQRNHKKSYSQVDHLIEQIGPLGLSIYKRKQELKKKARSSEGRNKKFIVKGLCTSDESGLVGLSHKTLNLLNELHLAFSASTAVDPVMALVHAGTPMIAYTLVEVIKSMPIFKNLRVGIALGCKRYRTSELFVNDDDTSESFLQGDDTDDEDVSSFVSGDLNVLIVTGRYMAPGSQSRPLPPTPLVIRFDGSLPDPTLDGGGGRCRVITFRESKPMATTDPVIKSSDRNAKVDNRKSNGREINHGTSQKASDEEKLRSDFNFCENATERGYSSDLDEEKVVNEEAKPEPASTDTLIVPKNDAEEGEVVEAENAVTYYCKPATILTINPNASSRFFLYRPLIIDETQCSSKIPSRHTGLEVLFLLLSEKLTERDQRIPLRGATDSTSSHVNLEGILLMDFQGTVSLTTEQLKTARLYTEAVCEVTHFSGESLRFFWEGIANSLEKTDADENNNSALEDSFFRRYMLLPNKPKTNLDVKSGILKGNGDCAERISQERITNSNELIATYFTNEKTKFNFADHPHEIDWETANEIAKLSESTYLDKEKRKPGMTCQEKLDNVEGSLLFSSFPNERLMLSGRLQYDFSPLTVLTRDRKFPLRKDGKLENHDDLVHLVAVEVPSEDLLESEKGKDNTDDIKTENDKKNPNPKEEEKPKSYSLARWCEKQLRLIPHVSKPIRKRRKETNRNKLQIFDAKRNVMKKRSTWVGRVRYSAEKYYSRYYPDMITSLHQPLLAAARPNGAGFSELAELLRGVHIEDVCHALVRKGREKRLIIPELGRVYPLPVGSIFLRPILFCIERHFSVTELLKKFDTLVGVRGILQEVTSAITASHVDGNNNYERLELLGDSVLKLSCTVRLFTRKPHDNEGQMHTVRKYKVCNERLHRLGHTAGIHNYVRFDAETLADWKPPATDVQAKVKKLSLKGLADVVEALCGAYFLSGLKDESFSVDKNHHQSSERETSAKSMWTNGLSCYSSSDNESSSDVGDHIAKDEEKKQKSIKRRRLDIPNTISEHECSFSASSVERAYQAGYKFLEACKVFEDSEPPHKEVLLSSIHALHPKNSPKPTEVTFEAFPPDRRLLDPETPWETGLGQLEQIIGYKFKRRHLLLCAVTHNSYFNISSGREKRRSADHSYQRLEFLGDAVADFCVVCYLYEKYPELGPGELSELKGNVVSNEAFARTAVFHGFHNYIFAAPQSKKDIFSYLETFDSNNSNENGGHDVLKCELGEQAAPKILGDIFEGIIGAVFVDSGLQQAWNVCHRLLSDSLRINADPKREDNHPCSVLKSMVTNEWKLCVNGPTYDMDSEIENGTRKKVVTVRILGVKISCEKGTTIKRAKLRASVAALQLLNNNDPNSVGANLLKQLREESVRRRIEEQRTFGV